MRATFLALFRAAGTFASAGLGSALLDRGAEKNVLGLWGHSFLVARIVVAVVVVLRRILFADMPFDSTAAGRDLHQAELGTEAPLLK